MRHKEEEWVPSEVHKTIIEMLKAKDITNLSGGVQLFANQFDKEYSISVNFMSTGLRISKQEVDEDQLINDPIIKLCKTFECVL